MSTIHSQPHFVFLFSPTKQLGPGQTNLNCPFNEPQSRLVLATRKIRCQNSNPISAHHMVLGLTSKPPKHGDISVLLITGSAFLLLYWVANFVVPGIIMKDLKSDEGNEVITNDEGTLGSENGSTDGKPLGTKRGFGGTNKK